jgi:hypothetical protein
MFDPTPQPDLNAFVRGLADLSPSGGGLDRDRLLFAAGGVLPTRRLRWWRGAAAALAVLAAGLAAVLWLRPPTVVERVVVLPAPEPESAPALPVRSDPAPEPPPGPLVRGGPDVLQLRQQLQHGGEPALPPAVAWSPAEPPRMPADQLLGVSAGGERISPLRLDRLYPGEPYR